MIQPNIKARLTAKDLRVVANVVYDVDVNAINLKMFEKGLDSQKLYEYVIGTDTQYNLTPVLVFYVLCRHFLLQNTIDDIEIAEYLGALLLEFVEKKRVFSIAKYDDEIYTYLYDLYADMERTEGNRKFLCATHLGDYGLWMSGLFPDHITNIEYCDNMALIGYKVASIMPQAQTTGIFQYLDKVVNSYRSVRQSLTDLSHNTHLVS
jgi:hypothetical protein